MSAPTPQEPCSPTRSPRRERDRQRREDEILDAAEGLFAERGFQGTAMSSIAKRADLATGTLYLYFRSKEELYQSLVDRKGKAHLDQELAAAAAYAAAPALDQLLAVVRISFAFCREHRDFVKIYVSEFLSPGSRLSSGLSERGLDHHRRHRELTSGILARGMASGEFPQADPLLLDAAIDGLLERLLIASLEEPPDPPQGAAAEELALDLLRRMLQPS
jgi:AcrR family transcriptional regulator